MKFIKNNKMKKRITVVCLLVVSQFFAQSDFIIGSKFDFSPKVELDAQLVLKDNYNHYLVSYINTDGIQAKHQITVRKFDQKNNLVDTFTQNFAIDLFTLHNYHGAYELDANKIVVFIESYSGKRKAAEIFSYIFDKTSGKFTAKVLASYPILSAGKSGALRASRSQNGNYFGLVYQKYNVKKEPEENDCMLLNAKTLDVIWKKTATFQDESASRFLTVTNSGKLLLVRDPKSYKETNYISLIDDKNQETKNFEEKLKIHHPIAISIGNKDYLIAFNYKDKGIRRGDFGYVMFYDLEQGKVLYNNDIDGFGNKDMKEVLFSNVIMENNEIRLTAEGKAKLDVKPTTAPGSFNNSFFEEKFIYGPASLLVFSNEGTLKKNVVIKTNDANREADLYHSFGLLNIKGNYYINTGLYNVNFKNYYGYYKINPADNFESTTLNFNFIIDNDYSFRSANQLMSYTPDTNKIMMTRTSPDNKMFFISMALNQ
jgi:hypothetical protein